RSHAPRFAPRSRFAGIDGSSFATGFHPRKSGRTLPKRAVRHGSRSGLVRNVTVTHTMLVTTVVRSAPLAKTSEPLPLNGCQRLSTRLMASDDAIAEISLHALMRHQYQRRMYTAPVPAPTCSTISQPEAIEPSCTDTHAATITSSTVHSRETIT